MFVVVQAMLQHAQEIFRQARSYILDAGLGDEIAWQRETAFGYFSEPQFLREAAWVVLCSGFRERTVRGVFDHVSLCFFDWESAAVISKNRSICIRSAVGSFNNRAKLAAIASCAKLTCSTGFAQLKSPILHDPYQVLQRLPYIGPVTAWHLAKNLGLDVVKPDRHLMRLASFCSYSSPWELCRELAETTGEAVKVVDLILWRYLAGHSGMPARSQQQLVTS